nr:hypothetical protein [Novosphingobium marinum]
MERFRGKCFAFGSVDCAKMTAFHLRQLGHKVRLSKAGQYRSLKGAVGALKRLGYDTLPDAMDGHGFARIAPAFCLIGDIVSVRSEHPIGALAIAAGNGNFLGFHESHEMPTIMLIPEIETAWRVL